MYAGSQNIRVLKWSWKHTFQKQFLLDKTNKSYEFKSINKCCGGNSDYKICTQLLGTDIGEVMTQWSETNNFAFKIAYGGKMTKSLTKLWKAWVLKHPLHLN